MKKVSIIGLGWLGEAAALLLQRQGYLVLGSSTRPEKVELLRGKGLDAIHFALDPDPKGTAFQRLFDSEIMIVTLPARSRLGDGEAYLQQLASLRALVAHSAVKHVVFISSTGVYPNANKAVPYTEAEQLTENNVGNAILYRAEQLMANSSSYALTILRMGGLMGANRIPGSYFSGKDQVVGHTRVNFIHQDDAARMIAWVVDQGHWNQIFNGVAPEHPLRREVYAKNVDTLGILPPASYLEATDEKVGREISSEKISATGFRFDFPNPLYFSYSPSLGTS